MIYRRSCIGPLATTLTYLRGHQHLLHRPKDSFSSHFSPSGTFFAIIANLICYSKYSEICFAIIANPFCYSGQTFSFRGAWIQFGTCPFFCSDGHVLCLAFALGCLPVQAQGFGHGIRPTA